MNYPRQIPCKNVVYLMGDSHENDSSRLCTTQFHSSCPFTTWLGTKPRTVVVNGHLLGDLSFETLKTSLLLLFDEKLNGETNAW